MPAKKDIRILIVDDYQGIRAILRNSIYKMGFPNLVEADNGRRALEIINEEQVNFVITDWDMPKMTGIELLKAIRANEATKELPVLLITAEAETQNIVAAIKAQVSGFMVKPFTEKILEEKINEILGKLD